MLSDSNHITIVITGPDDSLEKTVDASDPRALKRAKQSVSMLFDDCIARAEARTASMPSVKP